MNLLGIVPAAHLMLLPLLALLPGWAFFAGGRQIAAGSEGPATGPRFSVADILFVSVALSGWAAQTLALAGLFTLPAILVSVGGLSLAALLRRGPRAGLHGARLVARDALRPAPAGAAAALAATLLAALLYLPPVVTPLAEDPAPAACFGLGSNLARSGALPAPEAGGGLSGAASSMRSAAGHGLFFPSWIALLQLTVGFRWSGAAPALFAALSLAAAFILGRLLTGSARFGAAFLLLLGLNYPQAWLARVAVPESAAQFLLLTSAVFFGRAREGFRWIPAAAVSLGAAQFCSPDLLRFTPAALLLLLALHAAGPEPDRRRAALFTLGVLPFLGQARLQAALAVPPPDQAIHWTMAATALAAALISLRPPVFPSRRPLPLAPICWALFAGQLLAQFLLFRAAVPRLIGGSAHWMTWYVTLPFIVLLAGGLAELLAAPRHGLRLVTAAGPLFPLALVSLPFLFHHPPGPTLQPLASRPFTVAVIPVTLLLGLLFFHRMSGRLRHPVLRLFWGSSLGLLFGLYLVNLLPMAIGRPGCDAGDFVRLVAGPLAADGPPFTAVVEQDLGAMGLHVALEGAFGVRSFSLLADRQDGRRFNDLVLETAAAGGRTALLVGEGAFTPDPAAVSLKPLAAINGSLCLLPPASDRLPSSVITREMRLLIFEAAPAPPGHGGFGGAGPPVPARAAVRVGVYGDDWPYLAGGFRGVTRIGGRAFRWTGNLARIRLPAWTGGVTLELNGFRPPGAPEALITAEFAGQRPSVEQHLPRRGFVTLFVPRPTTVAVGPGPLFLELRSSCFRPGPWFTGVEDPVLGVQLASLVIHPPGTVSPVPAPD